MGLVSATNKARARSPAPLTGIGAAATAKSCGAPAPSRRQVCCAPPPAAHVCLHVYWDGWAAGWGWVGVGDGGAGGDREGRREHKVVRDVFWRSRDMRSDGNYCRASGHHDYDNTAGCTGILQTTNPGLHGGLCCKDTDWCHWVCTGLQDMVAFTYSRASATWLIH